MDLKALPKSVQLLFKDTILKKIETLNQEIESDQVSLNNKITERDELKIFYADMHKTNPVVPNDYNSEWSVFLKVSYIMKQVGKPLTKKEIISNILNIEPDIDIKEFKNNLGSTIINKTKPDKGWFRDDSGESPIYGLSQWKTDGKAA